MQPGTQSSSGIGLAAAETGGPLKPAAETRPRARVQLRLQQRAGPYGLDRSVELGRDRLSRWRLYGRRQNASGTTERGAPKNPLQLGTTLWYFRHESRVTSPPLWVQNLILPPLSALAKLFGARPRLRRTLGQRVLRRRLAPPGPSAHMSTGRLSTPPTTDPVLQPPLPGYTGATRPTRRRPLQGCPGTATRWFGWASGCAIRGIGVRRGQSEPSRLG